MKVLRRHPILSGVILGLIVASSRTYLGQSFAIHHTGEIARQVRAQDPNDPLDGLWIIGLGITFAASICATIVGIVAGLIFYVELKRSAGLRLQTSARTPPRKLYQ